MSSSPGSGIPGRPAGGDVGAPGSTGRPGQHSVPEASGLVDLLRLHLATSYHFEVAARLLRRFGDAREVLRRSPARLVEEGGVTPALARRLTSADIGRQAERELELAHRESVTILRASSLEGTATLDPSTLRQGPEGPLILFARGEMSGPGALSIGIVGSRRPSIYGLRQTRRFSTALARAGVVVVSGLARGVDGESHRATLDAGGRTVAVLGSGLGHIYPPEHRSLAERIWSGGQGMVLSPFPHRASPRSHHFPLRNGVLSGISRVLLVVEAGEKSGSLITVDHALRQGTPVFAVPGRVDQPESRGCLRLVGDGAGLALDPEDLIVALVAQGEGVPDDLRSALAARLRLIGPVEEEPGLPGPYGEDLTRLFEESEAWHPDDLAGRLRTDVRNLLAELSRLEIEGVLRRLPGGLFARSDGS